MIDPFQNGVYAMGWIRLKSMPPFRLHPTNLVGDFESVDHVALDEHPDDGFTRFAVGQCEIAEVVP